LKNVFGARSDACSRTGASGVNFAGLIQQRGVVETFNARATMLPKALTSEAIVDGRADLAVQQTSELMTVRGVEVS
jgi:molybdate transport system substrate-binding protein